MNEIKPVFSDAQHANAEEVLRSIARLLGRQAAREMAALETTPDTSPNGGSDEQPQACASDDA